MTIPAIPDVIAYGLAESRYVSLSDDLTVSARNARIEVAHPDIGSLSLTTEQSVALRGRLEQAERDIDAAEGGPCEDGVLVEPCRCDCCGRSMAIDDQVAMFWDERIGEIVMHAGKCPEPEMWRVESRFGVGEWRSWLRWNDDCTVVETIEPYEDAHNAALRVREFAQPGRRIRLIRVCEARP